ncbi:hypothetical protein [Streptomyces sp. BE147]|nr:hypothetical protein [Streptomyces sp. BE147]MEE1738770.1 hypothetical protein [Streptomyces sp. BE147]
MSADSMDQVDDMFDLDVEEGGADIPPTAQYIYSTHFTAVAFSTH